MIKTSYRRAIQNSTPDRTELVGAVAEVARDTEARLLSAGLHDVRAWSTACADAGLTDESLAFPEHRQLFRALVVSADLGNTEWPFEFFRLWNESQHFPFGEIDAEVRQFFFCEVVPTGLPRWAEIVAELHRRRTAAQDHYRIGDDLLTSVFPIHQLIDTEVRKVTKPKRVTIPKHLRKAVKIG